MTRSALQYRPESFVRARLDEAEASGSETRADITAKRAILDIIQPDLDMGTQVFAPDREGFEQWGKAYLIACALAAPYKDHPDYSHKWAREWAAS